jgi:hypothetical protein
MLSISPLSNIPKIFRFYAEHIPQISASKPASSGHQTWLAGKFPKKWEIFHAMAMIAGPGQYLLMTIINPLTISHHSSPSLRIISHD